MPTDKNFDVKKFLANIGNKEATIAILGATDFFGEGCLASQPLRMQSATAMTDCELMRIDNAAMTLYLVRLYSRHRAVRRSCAIHGSTFFCIVQVASCDC